MRIELLSDNYSKQIPIDIKLIVTTTISEY